MIAKLTPCMGSNLWIKRKQTIIQKEVAIMVLIFSADSFANTFVHKRAGQRVHMLPESSEGGATLSGFTVQCGDVEQSINIYHEYREHNS